MLGDYRFIWNPAVGKNPCWLKLIPSNSPNDFIRVEGHDARQAHNAIMCEPEGEERVAKIQEFYEKFRDSVI